jgi:hypothetical protein
MSYPLNRVSLSSEKFVEQAISIVKQAQQEGISLRIMGGVAVYIHSQNNPEHIEVYEKLDRLGDKEHMYADLDLIGYRKEKSAIRQFFEKKLKYTSDRRINAFFGERRMLFYHPEGLFYVDVFFNQLFFCHNVDFGEKPGKGRLELDFPTISLADLVLIKTQIHDINTKDLVDLMLIFWSHEITETVEAEKIDGKYIARILADDWGFWYDATNNLKETKTFAARVLSEKKITDEAYSTIINRIGKLLDVVDKEPKTGKWNKRARIGTSKPWYTKVESLESGNK